MSSTPNVTSAHIESLMSQAIAATKEKADPRRTKLKAILSEIVSPGPVQQLLDRGHSASVSIQNELATFKASTGTTFNQACDRTTWQALFVLASYGLASALAVAQGVLARDGAFRGTLGQFRQAVNDGSICVPSRRSKTGTSYGHHKDWTEGEVRDCRDMLLRYLGTSVASSISTSAPTPTTTTTNAAAGSAAGSASTTQGETSTMESITLTHATIFAIATAVDALSDDIEITRQSVKATLEWSDGKLCELAANACNAYRKEMGESEMFCAEDLIVGLSNISDVRFQEIVNKLMADDESKHPDWFKHMVSIYTNASPIRSGSVTVDDLDETFGQGAVPTQAVAPKTDVDAAIDEVVKRIITIRPDQYGVVNGVLTALNGNKIEDMIRHIGDEVRTRLGYAEVADELRDEIKRLKASMTARSVATSGGSADGKLTYEVVIRKLADLFPGPNGQRSPVLDIDFPTLVWRNEAGEEVRHPRCPQVDPFYEFRLEHLMQLAAAFLKERPIWFSGMHGTGKTSCPEQFAARTGFPTSRINLDSNITRTDFVGKVDLEEVNGATVTKWVDGVLPAAMREPGWIIIDECDAGRPDLLFVLQRVTEGNGLTLTENGGEVVMPHELFRIAATANTTGNGDETGIYAGVRVMNQAFMDRFGAIVKVDYLSPEAEKRILENRFGSIDESLRDQMVHFANEMRTAFIQGEIGMTVSPRGLMSMAENLEVYLLTMDQRTAVALALEAVFLNRSSLDQRQRVIEIAQAAFDVNLDHDD